MIDDGINFGPTIEGKLLAIDPGSFKSGVVMIDTETLEVLYSAVSVNDAVEGLLATMDFDHLAIEGISARGGMVGHSTLDTVEFIGILRGQAKCRDIPHTVIPRDKVKQIFLKGLHKGPGIPDTKVRAEVIRIYEDEFGPDNIIGLKKTPGPLYGVKSHEWQALALALVYIKKYKEGWL